MKKINILLGALFVSAALFTGCKKEEQPRYIKVEILKKTGEKICQMEDLIDRNRATADPSTYDSLANYCSGQVLIVLLNELRPDTNYDQGDINLVIGKYDEYWRDKHPKKQKRVWDQLNVGVQVDVYRVCEAYSSKLLISLKNYCEGIVNGSPEWTDGQRNHWIEDGIRNLIIFDPDPSVEWQYKDRLFTYFKDFAVNPNAKAKFKRDGFLDFGWGN